MPALNTYQREDHGHAPCRETPHLPWLARCFLKTKGKALLGLDARTLLLFSFELQTCVKGALSVTSPFLPGLKGACTTAGGGGGGEALGCARRAQQSSASVQGPAATTGAGRQGQVRRPRQWSEGRHTGGAPGGL